MLAPRVSRKVNFGAIRWTRDGRHSFRWGWDGSRSAADRKPNLRRTVRYGNLRKNWTRKPRENSHFPWTRDWRAWKSVKIVGLLLPTFEDVVRGVFSFFFAFFVVLVTLTQNVWEANVYEIKSGQSPKEKILNDFWTHPLQTVFFHLIFLQCILRKILSNLRLTIKN